jgi:PAS domain S-box-containing protein
MGNPTQSTSLNGPDSRRGEMAQAFQNFQHCVQRCQKAVFFTDAAGVLQRVNPAFEQLTGYTSTECVGRDLSWLASAGPSSKAYKRIWQEIFDNRTFRGVLEVRRKDGSSFEMELTAIPVRDSKGQITSLVCTGQDFREQREMEAQLREARRLNAVSVLPRAFAHDLNNLLMVITGCAELSLDALPQDSPVSRNLQEIRTASQRASELSREMLSLGSVGTQNLAPVCVNSVIQETSRILSRVIGPRIQLQVVLGDDISPTVADVRQLQQVLLNLAISARNAMPESGKFVLQTRTLEVDCSPLTDGGLPPGKYAQLSVVDCFERR